MVECRSARIVARRTDGSKGEYALYLLVTGISFLCYYNSLDGDFVHDDNVAVSSNPDVLQRSTLGQLFANDFWGKPMADVRSHKSYRPLTVFTFRLNHALRGGLLAWDFHVVNVALHSATTCLLTLFCRTVLKQDRESSGTTALLFASHPIHTEAVAGIVGRAEVLSGCLYFVSLIAFCRYSSSKETRRRRWLVVNLVTAALALLAKEQGVTVLAVCILYSFLISFGSRSKKRKLQSAKEGGMNIIFMSLIVLVGLRVWMLSGTLPQFSDQDNPAACSPHVLTRFLTYTYLAVFNCRLLLAPITLSYDWQMGSIPLVESFWDLRNLTTLTFFVGLTTLAGRTLFTAKEKERRTLGVSLATLIIPFLPASNLFFTVGFVVAERVLYIPSAGFCLLVSYGLDRLRDQGWRIAWLCRIGLCLLLLLFIMRTLRRNSDWASRETLFLSGLATVPRNAKVHYNYANFLKDVGNTKLAEEHYRTALRLWPDHASSHNNLGTVLAETRRAEQHFKAALAINPQHARAYFNLASLYSKQGQTELSIALLERAVDLEPDFAEAFSSLAMLLAENGLVREAERLHCKAITLDAENADSFNNYGIFLQKLGRVEEAVDKYQRAISIQPNHTAALVNAARTLKSLRNSLEAENLYKRALAVQEDPQIMDNLGVLYLSSGRLPDARKLYTKLLEKFPQHTDAKARFAQVLIQERSFQRAEHILLSVTSINSSHREALYQLAVLYTHKNRTTEALDYIIRALSLCSTQDRTCALLHNRHGDILRDLNALDEAAESYSQAIKLDTGIAHAHLNLAVIRHLQGRFQEALEQYQVAYSLEPENELIRENMEKLKRSIFRTQGVCNARRSKDDCRRW